MLYHIPNVDVIIACAGCCEPPRAYQISSGAALQMHDVSIQSINPPKQQSSPSPLKDDRGSNHSISSLDHSRTLVGESQLNDPRVNVTAHHMKADGTDDRNCSPCPLRSLQESGTKEGKGGKREVLVEDTAGPTMFSKDRGLRGIVSSEIQLAGV